MYEDLYLDLESHGKPHPDRSPQQKQHNDRLEELTYEVRVRIVVVESRWTLRPTLLLSLTHHTYPMKTDRSANAMGTIAKYKGCIKELTVVLRSSNPDPKCTTIVTAILALIEGVRTLHIE